MDFEFDVAVYYTDGVPGTTSTAQPKNVEQYVRLDLRLGWKPVEWAEIALIGQNLTDRRHYESTDFTLGQSTQVPRSGVAKVTLNFQRSRQAFGSSVPRVESFVIGSPPTMRAWIAGQSAHSVPIKRSMKLLPKL